MIQCNWRSEFVVGRTGVAQYCSARGLRGVDSWFCGGGYAAGLTLSGSRMFDLRAA